MLEREIGIIHTFTFGRVENVNGALRLVVPRPLVDPETGMPITEDPNWEGDMTTVDRFGAESGEAVAVDSQWIWRYVGHKVVVKRSFIDGEGTDKQLVGIDIWVFADHDDAHPIERRRFRIPNA